MKNHMKIFNTKVDFKTLRVIFDKINGFISVINGSKYLALLES